MQVVCKNDDDHQQGYMEHTEGDPQPEAGLALFGFIADPDEFKHCQTIQRWYEEGADDDEDKHNG